MKKICFIISAIALTLGVVSCQKDNAVKGITDTDTGSVKIHLGFAANNGGNVRADYTTSTAVPATDWNNNVKSMLFILTSSDGTIKVARNLSLINEAGHAQKEIVLNDVPAALGYIGYIIANYETATTPGITPNFSTTSVLGQNITALMLSLVQNTGYTLSTDEAAATKAYNTAGEVFIARATGIDVDANVADPAVAATFQLTRAVSMLRVRINKNFPFTVEIGGVNEQISNDMIEFTGANAANAAVRLRMAGTNLKYDGTTTAFTPRDAAATNVIYSVGGWLDNIPAGYVLASDGSATTQKTAVLDDDQQVFKDMLILPGGAATGAGRFDIVVTGWAPAGYVLQGSTEKLTTGQLVHWSGTVNMAAKANNVLELNVELTSLGKGVVPDVTATGNLKVNVDLVPWGGIDTTVVPL
jgi:hypothetical protein